MTTHVRCGTLFAGDETAARNNATLGFGEDGKIAFVCDTAEAPPVGGQDTVLDYSGLFVMPGLLDVHTHLAYGNAKSEEDIDLYQPMEFRALRGLFFAQKVVAAGYTSICAPGDAGQISLSVRNAINSPTQSSSTEVLRQLLDRSGTATQGTPASRILSRAFSSTWSLDTRRSEALAGSTPRW